MIISTTFQIDGYKIIEHKGIVHSVIVRSPTLIQGFFGGLKRLVGGTIGAYTQMCSQARIDAHNLMIKNAEKIGANAIVGVRYDTSEIGTNTPATELFCYGTALLIEPINNSAQ